MKTKWSGIAQWIIIGIMALGLSIKYGGSASVAVSKVKANETKIKEVEIAFHEKCEVDAGFQAKIVTELQNIKEELIKIRRGSYAR